MSIYYTLDTVLSYNALINFIIGERGCGKSYSAKKFVAKRFIKKHKQFVYIRRYKTELKEAMYKDGLPMFFDQIKNDPELQGHKFSNKKDTMYIDDKLCGYAIPLSIANILKSSTYENVDTIIFDEFIIDKGCYHYLQNEVTQFLDLLETIGRLRNIRVIMLANAISITNPYFTYFDITLPYNSSIKTFKDGLIAIEYIKNEEYRKVKKESKFGKLIAGTDYGSYAIDNEFLRDSKVFISKRSKDARFDFIFILNNKKYGIWRDYDLQTMYVSSKFDPNCPVVFAINPDDHTPDTILLRCRTSPFFKSLIDYYRLGKLCFDNQKIKNDIMSFITKHLTY